MARARPVGPVGPMVPAAKTHQGARVREVVMGRLVEG
jgi:hypothetical protein